MKPNLLTKTIRFCTMATLMLSTIVVRAQDKIEIDKEEIGTWFERNWMWVAGGVVLILLIALMGRGKAGSRRTTTVIKDAQGHTKSVTTTEENI